MTRFVLGAALAATVLSVMTGSAARAQDGLAKNTPRITEIVVLGNKTLNKEYVITTSGLKVGEAATPAALEAAQRSLLGSGNYGMQRTANPEQAVKVTVTDVNPTTNEGKVLIQVEENDVVQGFNITGGPIPPKEIQALLQTKPGFILNINTLRADVERISKYYETKGYIATIDDEMFGIKEGMLNLTVVVGRVPIRGFTIRGLVGSKARLARRELEKVLRPGEYFNRRNLRQALNRLECEGIDTGGKDSGLDCLPPRSAARETKLELTLWEKQ